MGMEESREIAAPHITALENKLQVFVEQIAQELHADAVTLYLEVKRRRDTDARIRTAFGAHDSEILAEVESMLEGQAWPAK